MRKASKLEILEFINEKEIISPFETDTGLRRLIYYGRLSEETREDQYTDIQLQFLNLLKKYPIKNPETVVDYVTSQGETVLEDPEKLAQGLSECEISPVSISRKPTL